MTTHHETADKWTFYSAEKWTKKNGVDRIEWLSDNGPAYTAHATIGFAAMMGLYVCNTPY